MGQNNMFDVGPFSLGREEKSAFLNTSLSALTKHHFQNCMKYKRMVQSIGFDVETAVPYAELPYLPVRLFKMHDLYSVDEGSISKTMTSSGTSGQKMSKIFIDKETSINQTKALTKIVLDTIGGKRSPMIIIDSPSVLKNRKMFSARGAGILGFSPFGTKRTYALRDDMTLDVESLTAFVEDNKHSRIFLFGFTFMVYLHFIKELKARKLNLDLSNAVLVHGGGWKKLERQAVSSKEFRHMLKDLCGIENVYDYYGMVEQTGSIHMECEMGHLHASIYSDVIIRNPHDFSVAQFGETGIIQTVSVLPRSYPGHSLLTEDEGVILGEDDCECGRLGKYFKIEGRIKNAEIRGCSDTYEP